MKNRLIAFLIILLAIMFLGSNPTASAFVDTLPNNSPPLSASDIIAAINNYRTQNGLAALTTNSLLNSLAKTQANYQASIESVTHTGPDGSTPQDRATAAGYGNGAGFYYSEIIYGGYNASAADALNWWKNSSTHNYYILQSTYVEIGAGVATSGNTTYFTAVLAGPFGDGSSTSSGDSDNGSSTEGNLSQPTIPANVVFPVRKSTPNEDGSITHIVREGQTLWTIAAVYEVELEKLLELNDLNNYSFVFPGDELLIQPAGPSSDLTTESTSLNSTTPSSTKQPPINDSEEIAKVLGTPVALNTAPKFTSTPIVITIPAAPNNDEITEEPSIITKLIPQDPTIRLILIIAFSILFFVVVGSMFIQKP